MDDVLPKPHRVLALLLKLHYRLAGLGLTKIPGVKLLKGTLQRLSERRGQILISCQGCKVYIDPMDLGIVPFLLSDGVYERCTTELFKSLLKPGMVVLDIGANFGYYGLIAARFVGSTGKVYAFEPEPKNFRLLVNNVKLNALANMIPLQIALSNENGKASLFLHKTNLGAHSIRQRNVMTVGDVVEIETTTLDNFVQRKMETQRVDLIIMDVQGAEGLVIAGADQTLRRNDVKILMELWPCGLRNAGTDPRDLIRKLYGYGFAITVIAEPGAAADLLELAEILKNRPDQEAAVNLFLEKIPFREPIKQ